MTGHYSSMGLAGWTPAKDHDVPDAPRKALLTNITILTKEKNFALPLDEVEYSVGI